MELDTETMHELMPFTSTLDIEAISSSPEEVRARLRWAPELCTSNGVLHGGALMTLADTLGAACAFLNLPDGAAGTTTLESKTNLFRAVRDGHVEGVARPLHAGRTTIVVETELSDAEGRLVAKTAQTQLVLAKGG